MHFFLRPICVSQIRPADDHQQRSDAESAKNVKDRSFFQNDERNHHCREAKSPADGDHFSTAPIVGECFSTH